MRRLLLSLVILGGSAGLGAAQDIQKVTFGVYAKDVADASYTYCLGRGLGGDPFGSPIPGRGTIKTTGSTTTIDEAVVGSNPFAEVAVGDILVITVGPTTYRRSVQTRASAAQITVDTAINLPNPTAWGFYDVTCGTGAGDGWVPVSLFTEISFGVDWRTDNATSLDHSYECKLADSTPAAIEQESQTATGSTFAVVSSGIWDQCRIGLKLTGDTGAQVVDAMIAFKGFTK